MLVQVQASARVVACTEKICVTFLKRIDEVNLQIMYTYAIGLFVFMVQLLS